MILEISSKKFSQLRNFPASKEHPPRRRKQLSTVAILLCRFMSCLVSQKVFQVVSALQSGYRLCIFFYLLIRSLVDPMLAAFIVYRMRALAVSRFSNFLLDAKR